MRLAFGSSRNNLPAASGYAYDGGKQDEPREMKAHNKARAAARRARLAAYRHHRQDEGLPRLEAAARVGVTPSTAKQYDAELRAEEKFEQAVRQAALDYWGTPDN